MSQRTRNRRRERQRKQRERWPDARHECAPIENQSIEARDENTETADSEQRRRHARV